MMVDVTPTISISRGGNDIFKLVEETDVRGNRPGETLFDPKPHGSLPSGP